MRSNGIVKEWKRPELSGQKNPLTPPNQPHKTTPPLLPVSYLFTHLLVFFLCRVAACFSVAELRCRGDPAIDHSIPFPFQRLKETRRDTRRYSTERHDNNDTHTHTEHRSIPTRQFESDRSTQSNRTETQEQRRRKEAALSLLHRPYHIAHCSPPLHASLCECSLLLLLLRCLLCGCPCTLLPICFGRFDIRIVESVGGGNIRSNASAEVGRDDATDYSLRWVGSFL